LLNQIYLSIRDLNGKKLEKLSIFVEKYENMEKMIENYKNSINFLKKC